MKKLLFIFLLWAITGSAQTFNIVILGSNYSKGVSFQSDVDSFKTEIMSTSPFCDSDIVKLIKFYQKQVGGLGCDDYGSLSEESIMCNSDKIKRAIRDIPVELADIDIIMIFVMGKGHGGSTGKVAVVGLGDHTTTPVLDSLMGCTFAKRAFSGKARHELGHSCGLTHDFTSWNVMSYACNGGCCVADASFTDDQKTIIRNYILTK